MLLSNADQALADGYGYGFGPVLGLEFSHQANYMISGRLVTDKEDGTNLFVRQAFGDELQDLHLARTQCRMANSFRQLGSNRRWNVGLALVHGANRVNHILLRRALDQVAQGAG